LDLEESVRKQLLREIRSLYTCESEYIVGFYGAFLKEGKIEILLEYMDAGSLTDVMKAANNIKEPIPEPLLANFAFAMLQGLKYLHNLGIVHRDIKPSNVTASKTTGHVKLCDFGIAKQIEGMNPLKTFTGTQSYMSPERIQGEDYHAVADIWSMGITLAELALGTHPYPYDESKVMAFFTKVINDRTPLVSPANGRSVALCACVSRCTEKDFQARPSASELLEDPWLACAASREEVVVYLKDLLLRAGPQP